MGLGSRLDCYSIVVSLGRTAAIRRPPVLKSGHFLSEQNAGHKSDPLPIESTILNYVLPMKLISTFTLYNYSINRCHSSN